MTRAIDHTGRPVRCLSALLSKLEIFVAMKRFESMEYEYTINDANEVNIDKDRAVLLSQGNTIVGTTCG